MRITCTLLLASLPAITLAQQSDRVRQATDLLPNSTVVFLEMPHPDRLLTTLQQHTLFELVKALPQYEQAVNGPQYQQFMAVVKAIESQIGMGWQEAFNKLTRGGIVAAFDAKTEGVALLGRAEDADVLQKTIETLIRLARNDAERRERDNPVPEMDYRGITVYSGDNSKFAVLGPWLVAVNRKEIGKHIVDAFLDGNDSPLTGNTSFSDARSSFRDDCALWGYVDVGTLRDAGVARDVFNGQTNNPVVELIVGGILSNLGKTPYAAGTLKVSSSHAAIEFHTPHKSEWVAESREYYFGPEGSGRAPSLIETDDTVFSLSTYRDVSRMWLRAGDLFNEKAQDDLAQADSNLSTLFAGRDFGEDVLGAIGSELQLVVTRQDFGQTTPRPAIRIPSFALVGSFKQPDVMRDEFRRTFQSVIGFFNVIGAMQGNPQLDLDMQTHEHGRVLTSAFIPEPDERDSTTARIPFNFSPSLALVGDRFALSSTKVLAGQLADSIVAPARNAVSAVNTTMKLRFAVLREILHDNREQLIAQNMLKEGQTRTEAAEQIDLLLQVLGAFDHASATLSTDHNQLQLKFAVQVADRN